MAAGLVGYMGYDMVRLMERLPALVGEHTDRLDGLVHSIAYGNLKPIAPTRVAEELKRLSSQRASGELDADEYEHRFSRMISELRDRRIDGSRAEILATLTPLFEQGVVSKEDWRRLLLQLGLA